MYFPAPELMRVFDGLVQIWEENAFCSVLGSRPVMRFQINTLYLNTTHQQFFAVVHNCEGFNLSYSVRKVR